MADELPKNLAEHFGRLLAGRMNQPWAIKRDALASAFANIQNAPHSELEIEDFMPTNDSAYQIVNGVAIIPITGLMWKDVPRIYVQLGLATDTTVVTREVHLAAEDPNVQSILLNIESPGGSTFGVQELADMIFNTRSVKPIHAHIEDMAASAAYWAASQALTVSANRTAITGSIGTFILIDDVNRLLLNWGIDTRVVSSAMLKGGDESGALITEAELDDCKRLVNEINDQFMAAVARGRDMTPEGVAAVATGQVWLSHTAMSLKLIDRIENSSDALERVSSATGMPGRIETQAEDPSQGGDTMKLFSRKDKTSASVRAQEDPPAAPPSEEEAKDGTLSITLTPQEAIDAGAQWRVGEDDWQDSGASVELAAGDHGVSYKSIEGYTAPADETVTIVAGEATALERTYEAAEAEETPPADEPAAKMTSAQALKLGATIGSDKALKAFAAGKTVDQALTEHIKGMEAKIAAQAKAINDADALGSGSAVPTTAADAKGKKGTMPINEDDKIGQAAAAIEARRNKNKTQ